MKICVEEYERCFSFDMTPETIEDAAMLVRVKLNGIKELREIYLFSHQDLTMSSSVVIGKRKEVRSAV